eukprot:scaffold310_cov335-Pavlova_lutheri.AAC.71
MYLRLGGGAGGVQDWLLHSSERRSSTFGRVHDPCCQLYSWISLRMDACGPGPIQIVPPEGTQIRTDLLVPTVDPISPSLHVQTDPSVIRVHPWGSASSSLPSPRPPRFVSSEVRANPPGWL